MRLQIIQHHPAEGPGFFLDCLSANALDFDSHQAYQWTSANDLPKTSSAPLILLGGPYSVNRPPAFLKLEADWLANCLNAGAPVFAICMGGQLLAKQLGAKVRLMPTPESGWCELHLSNGQQLTALQWHEEVFDLPAGARVMAHNTQHSCQGFRLGPHIALQFHPEWTPEIVAALNQSFGTESPLRDLDLGNLSPFQAVKQWLEAVFSDWYLAQPAK
jgi:GMP synthase-like glutamine amidotransferase